MTAGTASQQPNVRSADERVIDGRATRRSVSALLLNARQQGATHITERMRVERDRWGPGPNILATDTLAALRAALEETPLIIEHWFYRGGRAPDRHIFDDADALEEYLRGRARPGDDVWVWRFDSLCRNDNALTHGKIPDVDGTVPAGGAY